jgi:hypothetical protein
MPLMIWNVHKFIAFGRSKVQHYCFKMLNKIMFFTQETTGSFIGFIHNINLYILKYSLRFIDLWLMWMYVSRTLDTSISATSFMEWREYYVRMCAYLKLRKSN